MASPRVPGYLIRARLGAGASGVVYRAVHSDLGREVALKLLAPGLFDAEEVRARFLREAKLQARLSHPNLVQLLDAGFAGAQPYLATEYVPGGTLRELMRRQKALARPLALRLGCEIAAGLGHAHQAGIVHRDLKPENIFLTSSGSAKVGDFGLARSVAGHQTLQTAANRILGTPGYLAPEALMGQTAGPEADLYALGVILFEMLSGRRPFSGETLRELIDVSLNVTPEELQGLVPDVPGALAELVSSCLARDPGQRPDSAGAVVAVLECCLADTGPEGAPTGEKPGDGPTRRRPTGGKVLESAEEAGPRAARSRVAATVALQGRAEPALVPATMRLTRRWPAAPRAAAIGVAAATAVLLLALYRGWWGQEESGKRGPAGQAGAVSQRVTPTLPELPRIARIDPGTTVARLWFERPTTPGVVLERRTSGSGLSLHEVPAGVLSYRVTGLVPNRTAKLVMRAGPARQEVKVHTLSSIRGVDGSVLDATVFFSRIISLSVVQGPDRIVACWVREDFSKNRVCEVVERESRDDGETWSPIRTVVENLRTTAQVQLAKSGDGLVMVTCEDDPKGQRRRLWTRSWQLPGWRSLGTVMSSPWLRLALVDSASPQVEAVYSMPEGICWNRWPADRLPQSLPNWRSWTSAVTLVVGLPGRAMLMLHGALPQETQTVRLFTAVSAAPGELGAPGSRVEAITAPDEMVSQFSAAATSSRVVVAYTVNDRLRIRESADGLRFSEPVSPKAVADLEVRIPACCAVGEDLYVVGQGVSEIPDFRVQVLRNRPGSRAWEPVSRAVLMSPDVCDLRVIPLEKHLLILAGERMGGVLLLRSPLVPAAGSR